MVEQIQRKAEALRLWVAASQALMRQVHNPHPNRHIHDALRSALVKAEQITWDAYQAASVEVES